MNLKQQIVSEQIEKTATALGEKKDTAFLKLTHSLITDQGIHSFDENDIVDGGQDKQLDSISIFEQNDEATVYIIQAKNKKSFESNVLIKMSNGLKWLFTKDREAIKTISNQNFKDQIFKYRTLLGSIGPSNISVVVCYVTNAESKVVSDECAQELQTILEEYDNDTFASFRFEYWSSVEIVDRINAIDRKNKKISTDLKIRYDANTPSLIKYQTQGLTGIICSISATDIAKIVNEDKHGFVFDLNIRKYLGNRGSVNPEILTTCSDSDASYLFWFLNNGITIVCDKVDTVTDPDNPHLKLKNMQIVNGCQTASSLARAAIEKKLKRDTKVLVRIYETKSTDIVDQIVLTTNSQNKISGRNLRSNDKVQIDFEKGFKIYKLFYERKPRQHENTKDATRENIIPNDIVASSYLGICLKRCSDARSRKYKIWNEFYEKIFTGKFIEPYVLSSLIYLRVKDSLKREKYLTSKDETKRYLSKNASFHVARIFSHMWRGTDSWKSSPKIKKEISDLLKGKVEVDKITDKAFAKLMTYIDDTADLNNQLKSSSIETKITGSLNRKAKTK